MFIDLIGMVCYCLTFDFMKGQFIQCYCVCINSSGDFSLKTKLKLNSIVRVLERTIPTKRPPLVGEVIANFCG
jgi:hypothetical protein